jgi:hypothetical protein
VRRPAWLELEMYGCGFVLARREGLLRQVGNVTWEEGSRTREILVPFFVVDEAGTPGLVFLRNFLCIVLCE